MYLFLADCCNMNCGSYCRFSGKKDGEFMSVETACKALQLVDPYVDTHNQHVALGGGEPTLNPHFMEILELCLLQRPVVTITTNGSATDLMLEHLIPRARRGEFVLQCSIDEHHDPIDPRVVEAFNDKRPEGPHDKRVLRLISSFIRDGRCGLIWNTPYANPKNPDAPPYKCTAVAVQPNGTIIKCFVNQEVIGHVDTGCDYSLLGVGFVPCRYQGVGANLLKKLKTE